MSIKTYLIDYDNVLEIDWKINKSLIKYLNSLKNIRIFIWTSRRRDSYNEIKRKMKSLKLEWIICWKPLWDVYIDDKAINSRLYFSKHKIWK